MQFRISSSRISARRRALGAVLAMLRYPDGPHDAEALMVDPFEAAARDRDQGAGRLVTAGDISANGAVVALRTHAKVYIWERKGSESLATTLARTPCSAPAATERQSEALALSPNADRYDTSSEGVGAPIWEVVGAGSVAAGV